ncbi:hypothetical protein ACO0LD_21320 [Undibacterium sp. Ji83W]|uniref:hypothetical protein n=1 Tax=Undibacterium sp. Ji83W TaxID=3413043 RepID=UPI003BF2E699
MNLEPEAIVSLSTFVLLGLTIILFFWTPKFLRGGLLLFKRRLVLPADISAEQMMERAQKIPSVNKLKKTHEKELSIHLSRFIGFTGLSATFSVPEKSFVVRLNVFVLPFYLWIISLAVFFSKTGFDVLIPLLIACVISAIDLTQMTYFSRQLEHSLRSAT